MEILRSERDKDSSRLITVGLILLNDFDEGDYVRQKKIGLKRLTEGLIGQNPLHLKPENRSNDIPNYSEMYFCNSLVDLGRKCNDPLYNDEDRTICAYSLDTRNKCPRFISRKESLE